MNSTGIDGKHFTRFEIVEDVVVWFAIEGDFYECKFELREHSLTAVGHFSPAGTTA